MVIVMRHLLDETMLLHTCDHDVQHEEETMSSTGIDAMNDTSDRMNDSVQQMDSVAPSNSKTRITWLSHLFVM